MSSRMCLRSRTTVNSVKNADLFADVDVTHNDIDRQYSRGNDDNALGVHMVLVYDSWDECCKGPHPERGCSLQKMHKIL